MESQRIEQHIDESGTRRERVRATRRTPRSETRRTQRDAPRRSWTASAWQRCLEIEALVDVNEWAALPRYEQDSAATCIGACAFTRGLWSFLESVPFAEVHGGVEERIRRVHDAAQRALQRSLLLSPRMPAAPGTVVGFAAAVRASSGQNPWSCFRLHAECTASGSLFITVGLANELQEHPSVLAGGANG